MSPAAEPGLPRWVLVLAVGVPVALGTFSGAYRHTFDAWVHIFFGDHYLRGWFELWEPRWYGGFSVLSYPPLAHQLVAAVGALVGVEAGLQVVMAAAMVATPLAAASFARAVLGQRAVGTALVLAALWPTAHRFAWVYGQLPMLVATPLALFAMAALKRALDSGRPVEFALMTALLGSTAAAHHVSTLFAALGCVIVTLGHFAVSEERGKVFVRALVAGLCAALAVGFVIWPFTQYAALPPQTEIPHISRDPIWARPWSLEVAEQVLLVALGLVGSVVAAVRARTSLGLALGVLLFAVLSLGMTTPLPELLFRSQARWLTYDKFHHWAALFGAVLLAPVLARVRAQWLVLATLLPFTMVNVAHRATEQLQPPFVHDLAGPLEVLSAPGAERYRHLALGFGDQFCRFDVYGRSPNVDGDYHTARSDPLLRSSGIGTLDASKYYPEGRRVLETILGRADELGLRWVLVYDAWYFEPVMAAGYDLKDVWPSGVSLFEKASVPALPPAVVRDERFALQWGVVPGACLALAMALAWASRRNRASSAG